VSNYLKIAEKAKPEKKAGEAARPTASNSQTHPATKATETTREADLRVAREELPRDKSDISDKRGGVIQDRSRNFTPLTVSEALAEINRWGSGACKNTEQYRRGELSEEKAVEYVTCAILHRRGESFEAWRLHAPTVRKALSLCIHELKPEECKVCNGYVKKLIEVEAEAN
jgi:hypothetical protein